MRTARIAAERKSDFRNLRKITPWTSWRGFRRRSSLWSGGRSASSDCFKCISALLLFQFTRQCSPRNPEHFCALLVAAGGLIQGPETHLTFLIIENWYDGGR